MISVVACNKNNTPIETTEFPNTVGNHWHYIYGSNTPTPSFIDVDIIGEGNLPDGQSAKIWVYKILSYTDTTYVVTSAQTIKIYDKPCLTCTNQMPFERMEYRFPLGVGNRWFTSAAYGDTTKVLSQDSLIVPAGTFKNTYFLSKVRGYVTNSWTANEIWFTPYIGMTKLIQGEFSLGPVLGNGLWELASYTIL